MRKQAIKLYGVLVLVVDDAGPDLLPLALSTPRDDQLHHPTLPFLLAASMVRNCMVRCRAPIRMVKSETASADHAATLAIDSLLEYQSVFYCKLGLVAHMHASRSFWKLSLKWLMFR